MSPKIDAKGRYINPVIHEIKPVGIIKEPSGTTIRLSNIPARENFLNVQAIIKPVPICAEKETAKA